MQIALAKGKKDSMTNRESLKAKDDKRAMDRGDEI